MAGASSALSKMVDQRQQEEGDNIDAELGERGGLPRHDRLGLGPNACHGKNWIESADGITIGDVPGQQARD